MIGNYFFWVFLVGWTLFRLQVYHYQEALKMIKLYIPVIWR